MVYKKYNNNKKKIVRKRRTTIPRAPKDGQSLLLSAYFEVSLKQIADGAQDKMAYSIRCNPRNCSLTIDRAAVELGNAGIVVQKGDNSLLIAKDATSQRIDFARFAQFAPLYQQYKINFVKVSVMVDRECGLENPICFNTDKSEVAPHANMSQVVASAHKEYTMTESRRTAKYGWKPKDTADKEYHNTNQELTAAACHHIKVFQELEKKANGFCKHRVSLTMGVSLKDSTSTPVSLN